MCEFMDKMPFLAVLLQSFPESILLFSLGCAVWGIKLNFKKIIPAAAISALVSWGIRALPFPFGVHTVIGIAIITILFMFVFKLDIMRACVASFFSLGSLGTVEIIFHPLISKVFDISKCSDTWSLLWLRIIVPIPGMVVLGLLVIVMIKFKINVQTFISGKK